MRRLVIHAGFHKTGTTSIQQTLRSNRKILKPHVKILLKDDITSLCQAARRWSQYRGRFEMRDVITELEQLFERLADRPRRTICISAEDLAGHMPGRRGLTSYDAVPGLMQQIAETAARATNPPQDLTFFFTTRAPAGWLASSYVQHLIADRMTLEQHEYEAQFAQAADQDQVLRHIKQAVQPHFVEQATLEDSHRLACGPATPLLNLLRIPEEVQALLKTHSPANTSPSDDIQRQLLALNRSDLTTSQLRAAKMNLLSPAISPHGRP